MLKDPKQFQVNDGMDVLAGDMMIRHAALTKAA